MIALYLIGLLVGVLCVFATSRALLAPLERRLGGDILFRESDAAAYDFQPGGAINTETTHPMELEAAAAAMNAPLTAAFKRCSDIALSAAAIAFLAPMLVLTALAIKLDSPGPVFYRQRRVGFGGREFDVFKFRSMIVDAECDGPRYAARNDNRITRVGRLIRKFRIDEIPQAINVLRGEMSFIGPRPERPEFVRVLEQQIPLYHYRHLVKPGITGWAQVKYEYAASVDGARKKLRFDLYYIRHFSPLLDLMIVLMTVRVALFGLGSR